MTVYIASVTRRFKGAYGPRPAGDYATVGATAEPLSITDELQHRPPVENNVSHYQGTFATAADAYRAVRGGVPKEYHQRRPVRR